VEVRHCGPALQRVQTSAALAQLPRHTQLEQDEPSGQKPVKPNWNRLAPTKAVKARNQGLTNTGLPSTPSASEAG
jgi:hypothetical protein